MSSERRERLIVPSQDNAHPIIGDLIMISLSDSDDQRIVEVWSAILDGQMPDIPDLEIWRKVLLWMFLPMVLFSILLWLSANYKCCRHGLLPLLEVCQLEKEYHCTPYPPKYYHMVVISFCTYEFVCLHMLNCYLILVILFYCCTRLCRPWGEHLKRWMM